MNREETLAKLDIDKHYYGEFGQQWLSSSDIGALLDEDPLRFKAKSEPKLVFVQGSYFHVAVLEPHKLDKFEIIEANNRHSKIYKEATKDGSIKLLRKDVQRLQEMIDQTLLDIEAYPYIRNEDVLYELPGYTEIEGLPFKGKADIVNNTMDLVVDLKTTADIDSFEEKITQWNYDSQAYIYEQLFGKEFAWIAVCKKSLRVQVIRNEEKYRNSGREKVRRAAEVYKDWFGLI